MRWTGYPRTGKSDDWLYRTGGNGSLLSLGDWRGIKALMTAKFDRYDEYDESRNDFSRWKGIYETWQRRKQAYREDLRKRDVTDTLRVQPAY